MRLDPDFTVLAKVNFTPPPDMLKEQLKSDVTGRLYAVQTLGKRDDQTSIDLLQTVLKEDPFHGVRSEAAKALKKIGSSEARAVLIAGLSQADSRVRRDVVDALAAFPHQDARNALWAQSLEEKNPLILAAIIRSWGARPGEAPVAAALRKHLDSTTYAEQIASAAITALKAQDDAASAPFILARLKRGPENFVTRDYADALNALAFLSRKAENRGEVRNFLVEHLSHPKQQLRTAAAQALGTLGDPSAIAVLEPLTRVATPYNDPVREAAAKSVQSLQNALESPVELRNLWQRIQDLEKRNETQDKELKRLQEQQNPPKKENEEVRKAA